MSTKVTVQQVLAAINAGNSTIKSLATTLGVTGATAKKHTLALLAGGAVAKRGTQKASSANGRGRPADLFVSTGVAYVAPAPVATAGATAAATVVTPAAAYDQV